MLSMKSRVDGTICRLAKLSRVTPGVKVCIQLIGGTTTRTTVPDGRQHVSVQLPQLRNTVFNGGG